MHHDPKKQSGMTLIVVMSMLVLITLLAVSMIRGGTLNLQIAQNTMLQQEVQAATQRGIDMFVSDLANFEITTQTVINIAINNDPTQAYTVTMDAPTCLGAVPREGDSLVGDGSLLEGDVGGTPGMEHTYWELRATGTDVQGSGSTTTIVQGVRVLMLAGGCI